jgi:predicted ArsR family transcriptional regulator
MRFQDINEDQKSDLELRHRYEGDEQIRDRIKAVLLKSEGWKNRQIAPALRLHEEKVREHLNDWSTDEKLKSENGGSYSKFDNNQSRIIDAHLEEITYTRLIFAFMLRGRLRPATRYQG